MMSLDECLTKDTCIFLIRDECFRPTFSPFHKPLERRIFRKNFNHAELIGEELCRIRNLQCSHFFLVGEGIYDYHRFVRYGDLDRKYYRFRLGSYDFRNLKDFEYFKICKGLRNHSYFYEIMEMAPTEKNRLELLNEILDLFSLDTYMGQIDRYEENLIFQRNKKTKEIHVAPIFDFQYSLKRCYLDPNFLYGNILYRFQTMDDYREFMKQHPEFAEKLKAYLDIDLVDVAQDAYRKKGLIIPNDKIRFYREFDEKQKELIRTITK